jgi:hypothetical protein
VGQQSENKPSESKNGIWDPKSISIGNFIEEKIHTFRGQKAKSRIYKPSEPKYDRFFLHLHSWNKAMLGIQSNGPRFLKGS